MAIHSVSFRWSDERIAAVDAARGDVPRSVWVWRAIERALQDAESRRGAVAAAGAIVAQPGRFGESTVETAREVLADRSYRAPVAVRSHAPNCKCPVCS